MPASLSSYSASAGSALYAERDLPEVTTGTPTLWRCPLEWAPRPLVLLPTRMAPEHQAAFDRHLAWAPQDGYQLQAEQAAGVSAGQQVYTRSYPHPEQGPHKLAFTLLADGGPITEVKLYSPEVGNRWIIVQTRAGVSATGVAPAQTLVTANPPPHTAARPRVAVDAPIQPPPGHAQGLRPGLRSAGAAQAPVAAVGTSSLPVNSLTQPTLDVFQIRGIMTDEWCDEANDTIKRIYPLLGLDCDLPAVPTRGLAKLALDLSQLQSDWRWQGKPVYIFVALAKSRGLMDHVGLMEGDAQWVEKAIAALRRQRNSQPATASSSRHPPKRRKVGPGGSAQPLSEDTLENSRRFAKRLLTVWRYRTNNLDKASYPDLAQLNVDEYVADRRARSTLNTLIAANKAEPLAVQGS